jgi:hypothetical protein
VRSHSFQSVRVELCVLVLPPGAQPAGWTSYIPLRPVQLPVSSLSGALDPPQVSQSRDIDSQQEQQDRSATIVSSAPATIVERISPSDFLTPMASSGPNNNGSSDIDTTSGAAISHVEKVGATRPESEMILPTPAVESRSRTPPNLNATPGSDVPKPSAVPSNYSAPSNSTPAPRITNSKMKPVQPFLEVEYIKYWMKHMEPNQNLALPNSNASFSKDGTGNFYLTIPNSGNSGGSSIYLIKEQAGGLYYTNVQSDQRFQQQYRPHDAHSTQAPKANSSNRMS